MVARQDEHVLGVVAFNEVDVLVNGVGSALVPVGTSGRLIRRQHMYAAVQAVQVPWLSVADVLVEQQRLVLRQDTDCVDAGIDAVGEREINDAVLAAERNGGLCQLFGEGVQP